jgi:hypothetical protein
MPGTLVQTNAQGHLCSKTFQSQSLAESWQLDYLAGVKKEASKSGAVIKYGYEPPRLPVIYA